MTTIPLVMPDLGGEISQETHAMGLYTLAQATQTSSGVLQQDLSCSAQVPEFLEAMGHEPFAQGVSITPEEPHSMMMSPNSRPPGQGSPQAPCNITQASDYDPLSELLDSQERQELSPTPPSSTHEQCPRRPDRKTAIFYMDYLVVFGKMSICLSAPSVFPEWLYS